MTTLTRTLCRALARLDEALAGLVRGLGLDASPQALVPIPIPIRADRPPRLRRYEPPCSPR